MPMLAWAMELHLPSLFEDFDRRVLPSFTAGFRIHMLPQLLLRLLLQRRNGHDEVYLPGGRGAIVRHQRKLRRLTLG